MTDAVYRGRENLHNFSEFLHLMNGAVKSRSKQSRPQNNESSYGSRYLYTHQSVYIKLLELKNLYISKFLCHILMNYLIVF